MITRRCYLAAIFSIAMHLSLSGQWQGTNPVYTNSYVGIGIQTISSPLTLAMPTNHNVPTFNLVNVSSNPGCNGCINIAQKINVLDDQGTEKTNIGLWIKSSGARTNYAAIFENGNVGIGTISPIVRLHIESGAFMDAAILATSTEGNKLLVTSKGTSPAWCETFRISQEFYSDRNNGYLSFHRGVSTYGGYLTFGTSGIERVRFDPQGNVGIGTTSPSYKLDVNGTIRSNEVVVNTSGADFVFAPEYRIPGLSDIEKFINENKRLPEIPSAAEMQENGMNMSEMQTKLLQKIEELTLYIIELNKKIEKLENEKNK